MSTTMTMIITTQLMTMTMMMMMMLITTMTVMVTTMTVTGVERPVQRTSRASLISSSLVLSWARKF